MHNVHSVVLPFSLKRKIGSVAFAVVLEAQHMVDCSKSKLEHSEQGSEAEGASEASEQAA